MMSSDMAFRMYLDNEPATAEFLNRIDEITVEQTEDEAWQARIQIPLCVNDHGEWSGEDEDFMESFSRIRIEIRIRDHPFVPLIDGPVVGNDSDMSSEPGNSALTLMVHDDSVFLNRRASTENFGNISDSEIVARIFQEVPQIATTDIDDTPPPQEHPAEDAVLRGTRIQILYALAQRQGKQVYVLPGENPGESQGCFKAPPTATDGLEPLVLLGANRNTDHFAVQNDAQSPARVTASRLNFSDKEVQTETSSFQDLEVLGEEQAFTDESETTEEQLSPYHSHTVDLAQAVFAESQAASYALRGSGRVKGPCYPDVLRPYRAVSVMGANGRLSGPYVITQVTHRLTRSEYTQEFQVKRNARSAGTESHSPVSGSVQAGINISMELV